ncbi:UDP-N-acetylmuramoyl-L-alanyl-D-glutamate--2,6-diaminopimelate ligase [bacterium]|nr:MAG: UDP-N-acetylmuramoyl-L-alanyl-D-glutamate--2,6-diaminopimelate ligase [bacterium]
MKLQTIKNYFLHLPQAIFWNIIYRFPSKKLKIIGVTGTDGKTTTSNMIYHILKHNNFKSGMVSTISAKIGDDDLDTGFHVTSPNPKDIQKYLKMMVDKKIEYVVLETTSHALDQFRYWGIKFDYAVYTNITQDHFDYHENYENYLEAKLKLIDNLKGNGVVVANADDRSYEFIQKRILQMIRLSRKMDLVSYGIDKGINKAKNVQTNLEGIQFNLYRKDNETWYSAEFDEKLNIDLFSMNHKDGILDKLFQVPMLGNYNVYNALAAISVCENLKINLDNIATALSTFTSLPGRMEVMTNKSYLESWKHSDLPMIIVDFAHTPNALENALTAVNNLKSKDSKLIVIFGCAGLRDTSKRPIMGEVAAKLADTIILVPEDPRTEDLEEINNQIEIGIRKVEEAFKPEVFRFDEPEVKSRELGIAKAMEIANPQDIIVICGKGHEQSLCFGTTEYPYSDQEVVRKLIKD